METVRGEKNLREIKMISVNNSSVEGRGLQPAPGGGGGEGGAWQKREDTSLSRWGKRFSTIVAEIISDNDSSRMAVKLS